MSVDRSQLVLKDVTDVTGESRPGPLTVQYKAVIIDCISNCHCYSQLHFITPYCTISPCCVLTADTPSTRHHFTVQPFAVHYSWYLFYMFTYNQCLLCKISSDMHYANVQKQEIIFYCSACLIINLLTAMHRNMYGSYDHLKIKK